MGRGLGESQRAALTALSERAMTTDELADLLGVTSRRVRAIVQSLQSRGLVTASKQDWAERVQVGHVGRWAREVGGTPVSQQTAGVAVLHDDGVWRVPGGVPERLPRIVRLKRDDPRR